MALRRNPPARNPREGVLQYIKKEKERVCCTVLQLFSLASYFLHTDCRHLSEHHFGVLNSVLVQNLLRFCQKKTGKEINKHKKRHKNVFYSKTISYKN